MSSTEPTRHVVTFSQLVDWLDHGDVEVVDALATVALSGGGFLIAQQHWLDFRDTVIERGLDVADLADQLIECGFEIGAPSFENADEEDPVRALLDARTVVLAV